MHAVKTQQIESMFSIAKDNLVRRNIFILWNGLKCQNIDMKIGHTLKLGKNYIKPSLNISIYLQSYICMTHLDLNSNKCFTLIYDKYFEPSFHMPRYSYVSKHKRLSQNLPSTLSDHYPVSSSSSEYLVFASACLLHIPERVSRNNPRLE